MHFVLFPKLNRAKIEGVVLNRVRVSNLQRLIYTQISVKYPSLLGADPEASRSNRRMREETAGVGITISHLGTGMGKPRTRDPVHTQATHITVL